MDRRKISNLALEEKNFVHNKQKIKKNTAENDIQNDIQSDTWVRELI